MSKVTKTYNIIIDTNIWISFLIGKHLLGLHKYIHHEKIKVFLCREQLFELVEVLNRPKLKKFFSSDQVSDFFDLLDEVAQLIEIREYVEICRDPKDNFLLSVSIAAKADFLITGDEDLLIIKHINNTQIISYTDFETLMISF